MAGFVALRWLACSIVEGHIDRDASALQFGPLLGDL